MSVNLPSAPGDYDQLREQAFRRLVADELDKRFRQGANIELGRDVGINFTSPNGTRYQLTVSDIGAAVWTPL